MRTTVRIDDDLMRELHEQSAAGRAVVDPGAQTVPCAQGMKAQRQSYKPARPYREKAVRMGQPRVDLTKALALVASLEDSEIREKLARRK